jgi:hypothetical protein
MLSFNMGLVVATLLGLSWRTAAEPGVLQADLQVCPYNWVNKYFFVNTTEGNGVLYSDIYAACDMLNMRPANLTTDVLYWINAVQFLCYGDTSVFIGYYDGLPPLFDCWLMQESAVISGADACADVMLPIICEVPSLAHTVESVTQSVTVTTQTIVIETDTVYSTVSATFIVYTAQLMTTTETDGIVTTITAHEATTLCIPSRYDAYPGYQQNLPRNHGQKSPSKTKLIPDKAIEKNNVTFSICTTVGDYALVFINGTFTDPVSNLAAAACSAVGFQLANVTTGIFYELEQSMINCDAEILYINGYYQHVAACGLLSPQRVLWFYDVYGSDTERACSLYYARWALCKAEPPLLTTTSVFTGPFTTHTVYETETDVQSVVETLEEYLTTTEPFTSYVTTITETVTAYQTETTHSVNSTVTSTVLCTEWEHCATKTRVMTVTRTTTPPGTSCDISTETLTTTQTFCPRPTYYGWKKI